MNQDELNKYKEILEKRKSDLESEIKSVPLVEDMGNDTEGEMFDEEADEAEQMLDNAAVRIPLKEELNSVNHALEKIEKGAYGKCEKCDKELSKEMLEANPSSLYCKECKA